MKKQKEFEYIIIENTFSSSREWDRSDQISLHKMVYEFRKKSRSLKNLFSNPKPKPTPKAVIKFENYSGLCTVEEINELINSTMVRSTLKNDGYNGYNGLYSWDFSNYEEKSKIRQIYANMLNQYGKDGWEIQELNYKENKPKLIDSDFNWTNNKLPLNVKFEYYEIKTEVSYKLLLKRVKREINKIEYLEDRFGGIWNNVPYDDDTFVCDSGLRTVKLSSKHKHNEDLGERPLVKTYELFQDGQKTKQVLF